MSWTYLFIAGLLEIAWVYAMKQSDGFSKPLPTVVTIVLMIASFSLLAMALKTLPIGTAYAVWTGIGAVGAAIVGIVFLGEAVGWTKIICILLIACGIVGLKLSSAAEATSEPKSSLTGQA